MIFDGVYTKVEKSKKNDEFIQSLHKSIAENPIHCNFFELGAKVLQSLNSPSILGISKVERTSNNVLVYAAMHRGMSLPDYLASLASLSDKRFNEILTQILDGIVAIHSEGFYHQAINPNSFWVNEEGTIQLTLFETLEMRFCQQKPEGIKSESSLQEIHHYLSPERSQDLKILSFSDEYYSFGLLAWYIWCWKSGRLTLNSAQESLHPFEATGSKWDKLIGACLNPIATSRPNSLSAIRALLSEIKDEKDQEKDIILVKEKKQKSIVKPNPVNLEIALDIQNYSSEHYQIYCNNQPISSFFQKLEGKSLIVYVPKNAILDILLTSDNSLFQSFNTSKVQCVELPDLKVTPRKDKSWSNDVNNKSRGLLLGFILGIFIIICAVFFYNKSSVPPLAPNVQRVEMIPPDGYLLINTIYNDLLRQVGFQVNDTRWHYIEGNWEKFIPEEGSSTRGIWEIDNTKSQFLLDSYFYEVEPILSEGKPPAGFLLIKGNDSILYQSGKLCLDGHFYRYINKNWHKKEAGIWNKLSSLNEFEDVQESYFVEKELLNNHSKTGYINGNDVRYRSEPSVRFNTTILGKFVDYKSYSYSSEADEVYLLKEMNGWCLLKIKRNNIICWTMTSYFVESDLEEEFYGC